MDPSFRSALPRSTTAQLIGGSVGPAVWPSGNGPIRPDRFVLAIQGNERGARRGSKLTYTHSLCGRE